MSRELAAAWVDGWVVSRGTPTPVETAWGLRIDVGQPSQMVRYVLHDPDERTVRDLVARIDDPAVWIKTFVDPDIVRPWLSPHWVDDSPGWLMGVDLRREPVKVAEGYYVEHVTADGVTYVRVVAQDGVAARGQFGLTGRYAIVDKVSTEPEHQRRGLGTVVMRTLADLALAAGADTGVLGATVDGRALYEALGWKVHAPLAGFIHRPDAH